MFKGIKIDGLFIFLSLAICLIFVSSNSIKGLFNCNLENSNYEITTIDHKLKHPICGYLDTDYVISSYNPEYDVLYSLDGGDKFLNAGESINLLDVSNVQILYNNTSIRWRHPYGKFPELKSVVIKLRHKNKNVETQSAVYTFFDDWKSDIPVVSLSINNSELFDEFRGIMVYGSMAWNDKTFYKDWWYRSANFRERGMDWERGVNFQYFENGKLKVNQDCGIRISGNATRYFPQKSLRIYARSSYGQEKIDYPFWGDFGNKKVTSLLLRNSGNDNTGSLFADLLIHNISRGSNVLVQSGRPVSVFINGNYWGLYNIRERIDAYFIAKREGVKEEDITLLDGAIGELKTGSEKDHEGYVEFINNLPQGIMTEDEYMVIDEYISMSSFIDYILFETFFANGDWPNNNVVWYKAGNNKWKWVLNDLDYSMSYLGSENVNVNLFTKLKSTNNTHTSILFSSLVGNDNFKIALKSRAIELLETNLSVDNIKNEYQNLKMNYENELENEINRWRMIDSRESWEKKCSDNFIFLINRRSIFLRQIEKL